MSLEVVISPAGRLSAKPALDAVPAVDERAGHRIEAAFARGNAAGLLALVAGDQLTSPLPPTLAFWRDFARHYLQRLCQAGSEGDTKAPLVTIEPGELAELVLEAPPMRGGAEFLTPGLLSALWQELGAQVAQEAAENGGLAAWLQAHHPQWHAVGRVTFHLAENKRDESRPFAFLATYTHGISAGGRAQHLPLGRALQEYAGAKNKTALARLLAPVQRASEQSSLARELIESRRVFQPLAWTPPEAHRFLQDIPTLEASGLLVRVPDWWKAKGPAKPQVQVKIGQQPGGGLLGADSLLDFSLEVALDGQPLSKEEWKTLVKAKSGLVLLRGQWVQVDADRLQQVLERWQEVERSRAQGVSFLEGMRLLAGLGTDGNAGEEVTTATVRAWSQVVPGAWLRDTLAALRDPSADDAGFDPGHGLQATLRPYQAEGARWLHFLTRLGLGACLADDMGLGKTFQTIALLLGLQREADGGASTRQKKKPAPAPSLLVAPASLLANWKGEIARFAPTLRTFFAHPSESPAALLKNPTEATRAIRDKDLVVTTYALLTRLPWLRELDWRLVILDEAQAIKNPAARQTRAVKELQARGRVALTGTPVENRLGDLWSLFDFINPGLLGSAPEFSRLVKKLTTDDERHFAPLRQLTGPYILRRLKTDKAIIADLPDKTEVTAWCSLSKAQATMYEQAVRELAALLADVDDESVQRRGLILSFLMRFKQICNHPSQFLHDGGFAPEESGKFLRLRELAEEIAAKQEKALSSPSSER